MNTRSRTKIFNISVKAALRRSPEMALKSMYQEISSLHAKKVFKGVHPSQIESRKIIKSFCFLKDKYTSTGTFDKLKARLVAGGHMQDRSEVLFEDVSSPTSALQHLLLVATIAAKEGRVVKTVDFTSAYLNADMSDKKILVELDPIMSALLVTVDSSYAPYLRKNGSMVVELQKALYGCIESAKRWYDLLASTLKNEGFQVNPHDECVFNKLVDGVQITIVVYVDDLFISCKDENIIKNLVGNLRSHFAELTVHDGITHSYLGMTFDFSIEKSVKVTMERYIRDLLLEAEINTSTKTPATDKLFDTRECEKLDAEKSKRFHTLVAKLLYLAKRVRPDILLAVSFLTTRVTSPDVDDFSKLQRILTYLYGTQDFGIVLRADTPTRVQTYIDASFGVHGDGKSHSGLFLTTGSGPIMVKSSKQHIVTKSSTESELVALSDFTSDAIACRNFLIAQGELSSPALIFQDNQSTIALVNNGMSKNDRTRHINVRYFWTKERIDIGEIEVKYLPTEDMIADILTKPLQGIKFIQLRACLLNWPTAVDLAGCVEETESE